MHFCNIGLPTSSSCSMSNSKALQKHPNASLRIYLHWLQLSNLYQKHLSLLVAWVVPLLLNLMETNWQSVYKLIADSSHLDLNSTCRAHWCLCSVCYRTQPVTRWLQKRGTLWGQTACLAPKNAPMHSKTHLKTIQDRGRKGTNR
jgi:hypothetical protein